MIQAIGPHRVTNASIEDPIVDRMLEGERVHVLYSDPPWGDGNLQYWATMNRKMTGQERPALTYAALLDRFADLIRRYVSGHVFIETGIRWEEETAAMMWRAGLVNRTSWKLCYRSGNRTLQNVLLYGAEFNQHPYDGPDPTGWSGAMVSERIVRAVSRPGGIVFDPCCGMGYSARAAVAAGMVFRGNELNAKRLRKTVDFLTRSLRPHGVGAGVP